MESVKGINKEVVHLPGAPPAGQEGPWPKACVTHLMVTTGPLW